MCVYVGRRKVGLLVSVGVSVGVSVISMGMGWE